MLTIQSQQEAYEILADELKMAKARAEEALSKSLEEDKVKEHLLRRPSQWSTECSTD